MFKLTTRIAAVCISIAAGVTAARAEDLGPTLRKIKDAGAITIGHRDASTPLSYLNAEKKPIGFSLDLCALVVDKIKQKLGLTELQVNYQLVTSADRAALIQAGKADIECGATPNTAELRQQAGFSAPIYASELRWIVPKGLRVETEGSRWRQSKIPTTASDLRGRTVVLTQGSPATGFVLSLSSDQSLGLSILEAKDAAAGFRLLEAGQAVAVLEDDVLLNGLKANSRNPNGYGFLDDGYPGVTYGFTLRKDDKPFKDLVDGILAEAMTSGEYAKIYAKWFESPIPPKNVNLAYPMPKSVRQLIKKPGNQAASNQD
jgi:glutamate/aspartate transport system substrate-binding protein